MQVPRDHITVTPAHHVHMIGIAMAHFVFPVPTEPIYVATYKYISERFLPGVSGTPLPAKSRIVHHRL